MTAVERDADEVAQGSETAQSSRDQHADQRAVAIFERGQSWMHLRAAEMVVKRTMLAQHPFENIDGDPAGGEARDFAG